MIFLGAIYKKFKLFSKFYLFSKAIYEEKLTEINGINENRGKEKQRILGEENLNFSFQNNNYNNALS